jgi:hypothetical protein
MSSSSSRMRHSNKQQQALQAHPRSTSKTHHLLRPATAQQSSRRHWLPLQAVQRNMRAWPRPQQQPNQMLVATVSSRLVQVGRQVHSQGSSSSLGV